MGLIGSNDGQSVLQYAVSTPHSRPLVRKMIVECLLHRGATPSFSQWLPLVKTDLQEIVLKWEEGGCKGGELTIAPSVSDCSPVLNPDFVCLSLATSSRALLDMDLRDAEEWITQAGLGVEEPGVGIGGMQENDELVIDHSKVKEETSETADRLLAQQGESVMEEVQHATTPLLELTSTANGLAPSSHVPILPPPRSPSPPATDVPRASPYKTTSTPSSGPYFVRILHLPFTLPKHRLHEYALRLISAKEVLQVHIRSNSLDREATGHVELASSEGRNKFINRVRNDRYEGATLDAISCSSIEKDTESRPLIPHRAEAASVNGSRNTLPRVASSRRGRNRSRSPSSQRRWSHSRHSPDIRSPSRHRQRSRRSPSPAPLRDRYPSPEPSRVPSLSNSPPKPSRSSPLLFNPALYIWVMVRSMPRDWAERQLYETLEREGIILHHVILRRRATDWGRSAIVAIASKEDYVKMKEVAESIDVWGPHHRLSVDEYDPSINPDWSMKYPPAALQQYPYQPPVVAGDNLPVRSPQIVIRYLALGVSRSDLLGIVESVIGSDHSIDLQLKSLSLPGESNREQLATINPRTMEDGKKMIRELDGKVIAGAAVLVAWQRNRHDPFYQSYPRNRSPSPDSHRPRKRSRSLSPPRPSSNGTSDSQLSSSSSASRQLQLDLSRIRSLNLSQEDLAAIQRIWAPLDSAPPSTVQGTFQRQIQVAIQFGFLPRSDASLALKSNESNPAYPDDPLLQTRYVKFLESQAGISRDHYTILFSQVTDWNVYSEQFSNRGREEAEKVRNSGGDVRNSGGDIRMNGD